MTDIKSVDMTRLDGFLRDRGVSLRHAELEVGGDTVSEEFHSDTDAFLAHFGVKGMKWGVRRTDAQLGNVSTRKAKQIERVEVKKAKLDAKQAKLETKAAKLAGAAAQLHMDRMKPGETVIAQSDTGTFRTLIKREDGKFDEIFLSADAERYAKTAAKDGAELSTKEMSEALKRAETVERYNALINPKLDPNQELATKVAALKLERDFKQVQAEIKGPKKPSMVKKFAGTLIPDYKTFQSLDKVTGGVLSDGMKKGAQQIFAAFGVTVGGKSGNKSGSDQTKTSSDSAPNPATKSSGKKKSWWENSSPPKQDVPRPDVVYDVVFDGTVPRTPTPMLAIERRQD